MNEALSYLKKRTGSFVGEGTNHEGKPFTGRLTLEPLLGGRGLRLQFSATGKDGAVYHKEESIIALSMSEKLVLWNFNTNTPGLVPHELRSSEPRPGAEISLTFCYNQPTDKSTFREEVELTIWGANSVSYSYSWGLPGGDFQTRSTVLMKKEKFDFNRVEFLSAALLVSKKPRELATFYRDVIGVPLKDEKHGETELHYGCELGDLHFAIHPIESLNSAHLGTGSVKLAFTVFDMESFVKRIENHGIKLEYPPKDTGFAIMTAFFDPDGNYLEFTQLSDRWFEYLKERKATGHDVVKKWELSKP